jgi:tetratricopeptide (TPR) repeat protein
MPRARLGLFISVCQAVQHAHHKGIIHRDLKPSNVLVALHDDRPVVKVIDFGIAKVLGPRLTDQALWTAAEQVIGTPLYMSPEQAGLGGLDVDTRSDVYSLGVVLYELLTGTTPFDKDRLRAAGQDEFRRIIREEEPARPSTRISTLGQAAATVSANRRSDPKKLGRLLRGELDWMVMKALEKDRSRRYETANAFAQDIQRYLADEPVQACPPSAGYRFRKFARRNKGVLMTAALVAAALLVGTAVSVWQAVRATEALESERRTRAALDLERTQLNGKISDALVELAGQREKARAAGPADGKHWAQFQDAARRAETLVASELADPALVQRVRDLLGQLRQDELDRRMVARLEEIRLERLAARVGTPAPSDVGDAFAAAFREYGLPVTDLPVAEAAGRVRDSGVRDDLLAGLDAWSVLDARSGGTAWKGLLTVAQAADDHPWRRECRDAVLRGDRPSLVRLARREDSPRQPAEAVLLLAGALAVLPPGRAATDEEVSVAGGLLEKARVWHPGNARLGFALAAWFRGKSRVVDVVALARESIERLEKDRASPELRAAAYFRLAGLLGVSTGAVAAYRQAVRLMPGRADYWAPLIEIIINDDEKIAECSAWIESGPPSPIPYRERGNSYVHRQHFPEALRDFVKLTELYPQDADAWDQRAHVHVWMHQNDEARAEYTKAIEAAQHTGKTPAPYFAARAWTYGVQGQWDKVIADLTQAIDLDPTNGNYWAFRGDAYLGKGDIQKALADYDVGVKKSPSPGYTINALRGRAQLNERLGRWDKAISDWTEFFKINRGNLWEHQCLFRLLITCPDRALRDPRRALALDKEYGPLLAGAPDDRGRLLGLAHFQLGEWKEASAALTKLADRIPEVGFYLAMAHWHLGNKEEARKCYDRGMEWRKKGGSLEGVLEGMDAEAASLLGLTPPQSNPVKKAGS